MIKVPATRWLAATAVSAFTLFFVSSLQAAPPGSCEPWPSCKDGGDPPPDDGGESPSQNPTVVNWVGLFAPSLGGSRECILESALSNGSHGVYVCQLGAPTVDYNLAGIPREQTARKGNSALCSLFDGATLAPDSKYTYAWDGNCQDG